MAQSGLAYTMLRPNYFMQNFLLSAPSVAGQGVLYGMTGQGRTSYIDTRDVAAVAAQALTAQGMQAPAMLTGAGGLATS